MKNLTYTTLQKYFFFKQYVKKTCHKSFQVNVNKFSWIFICENYIFNHKLQIKRNRDFCVTKKFNIFKSFSLNFSSWLNCATCSKVSVFLEVIFATRKITSFDTFDSCFWTLRQFTTNYSPTLLCPRWFFVLFVPKLASPNFKQFDDSTLNSEETRLTSE